MNYDFSPFGFSNLSLLIAYYCERARERACVSTVLYLWRTRRHWMKLCVCNRNGLHHKQEAEGCLSLCVSPPTCLCLSSHLSLSLLSLLSFSTTPSLSLLPPLSFSPSPHFLFSHTNSSHRAFVAVAACSSSSAVCVSCSCSSIFYGLPQAWHKNGKVCVCVCVCVLSLIHISEPTRPP